MPSFTEGSLTFEFPAGWDVSKLDGWSFYRNQFQSVCDGTKAVDLLAIEPDRSCVWCIEVKDYRAYRREKALDITDEMAAKVRDSLALLAAANVNASDHQEKALAGRALRARRIRVVLHLEQPAKPSKLFPRKIDLANVQQRLCQLVRAIDPHALAREQALMGGCGWAVR
jgi:hypothetical protein